MIANKTPKSNQKTRSFAIGALCFCVVLGFYLSPAGYDLNHIVGTRLDFKLRALWGQEPELDPRIKILGFDTTTMRELMKDDLDLAEWGMVFEAIGKRNPQMILIDKIFGTFRGLDQSETFKKYLRNTAPVIAGSYVQSKSVSGRTTVAPENKSFDIIKMFAGKETETQATLSDISWLKVEPGTIFGPDQSIRGAFSHIGHLIIEKFGFVKPLLRVEESWAVPHWSFFSAKSFSLGKDGIRANGFEVPTNSHGFVIPNFISSAKTGARAKKILNVIFDAKNSKSIDGISEGDVVVILPALYVGHTDWVDTPLERMPGGYLMVAMINSVLTGNWLRPIGGGILTLFLTCLLGTLVGTTLRAAPFMLTTVIMSGIIIATGTALFSLAGLVCPWLFPTFGFLLSGVATFAEKTRQSEMYLRSLKQSLKGRISEERIDRIMKNPEILKSNPEGKIITIMFVDIVGFSQMAEVQTPGDAFSHLRGLFKILRAIVHKHNGVVDKTLGDGMLCYFGYGPDGEETSREHADQALACAIEIQTEVLAKNLQASIDKMPIYPLRVGINTSAVFMGNLGSESEFDFTVIGNGVNLAKRLETACQHYSIMIGSTTYDTLLDRGRFTARMSKRFIPIKNTDLPLEAYECYPFVEKQDLVDEANNAYRKFLGIERREPRWHVPTDTALILQTSFGPAKLFNFSRSGFAVVFEKYYGNGIQTNFSFDFQVSDKIPTTIVGEIRWGCPLQKGYLHGIQIKNLSVAQKDELVAVWRNATQRKVA